MSTFDVAVVLMDQIKHANKDESLSKIVERLFKMPSSILIRTPESLKIAALEPTTSLKSVFDIFANPSRHIHRALVRQRKSSANEPSVLRMLEQEDVIRFMLADADSLGTFVHRSIEELGMLKERHVISVTDQETALDAVARMVAEGTIV